MKKATLWLCAGMLALGITACGRDGGEESSASESGTESTESLAGSGEGAGGSADSADGSGSPEGSAGAETGAGSGGISDSEEILPLENWSEEMEALKAAVREAVGQENYWPDMMMDPEIFEMFVGIGEDLYEDYMAESPMISANVDTLVIVKAKEGQADAAEEALNAYRDAKVNDTMQYPMNLGKIQASMVERIGDYVIFVQLGAETPDDEEDAITQCREANEAAIEAIRGVLEGGASPQ